MDDKPGKENNDLSATPSPEKHTEEVVNETKKTTEEQNKIGKWYYGYHSLLQC